MSVKVKDILSWPCAYHDHRKSLLLAGRGLTLATLLGGVVGVGSSGALSSSGETAGSHVLASLSL